MKATIALYKSTKYGFTNVHEVSEHMENSTDSVRTSKPLEVEFEELPAEDIVSSEVESLRAMKVKTQSECEVRLQAIDKKISELLALPNLS